VKDIYRDLPAEVTAELEQLYQVPDLEAFRSKLERADLLFQAAVDRASRAVPPEPSQGVPR
jgi:hypothetical protein